MYTIYVCDNSCHIQSSLLEEKAPPLYFKVSDMVIKREKCCLNVCNTLAFEPFSLWLYQQSIDGPAKEGLVGYTTVY